MTSLSASAAGARHPRRRLFNRYLVCIALVGALVAGAAAAVNSVIDPLWFWRGNQITGRNFIFNERIAKLNLFLQDAGSYDCLIFGSSRVTLLDQHLIEGYRCANLSFSSGKIDEFLAYADYLAGRGIRPKLVIVGVDDFNFLTVPYQPINIPDFITAQEDPPGLLYSYLSLTALDFSQRTLRERSDLPRYYDDRFVGRVIETTPPFTPPDKLKTEALPGAFDAGRAALYRRFRDTFPEAEFWGFVPPISAWRVAERHHLAGMLEPYLDAMTRTAAIFDRFYDFSVPCPTTERADNTYDGSHYFPAVNDELAARLQANSPIPPADGFGLPVHAMSPADYRGAFRSGIDHFLLAKFPDLAKTRSASR